LPIVLIPIFLFGMLILVIFNCKSETDSLDLHPAIVSARAIPNPAQPADSVQLLADVSGVFNLISEWSFVSGPVQQITIINSTSEKATIVPMTAGTYTFHYEASEGNWSEIKGVVVEVSHPLIISGENKFLAGATIQLNSSTGLSWFEPPLSYQWYLDGFALTGQNTGELNEFAPQHPGAYEYKLTVTDNNSYTASAVHNVKVSPSPLAVIEVTGGLEPGIITFTGENSIPLNDIRSWDWSITPCSSGCTHFSNTSPLWKKDLKEGTYDVSLTIESPLESPYNGITADTTVTIIVAPTGPPIPSFVWFDSLTVIPPVNSIFVDGSASQNVAQFRWFLQYRASAAEPFLNIEMTARLTEPTYEFLGHPVTGQFQILLWGYNAFGDSAVVADIFSRL
jgi:hypothetical protein